MSDLMESNVIFLCSGCGDRVYLDPSVALDGRVTGYNCPACSEARALSVKEFEHARRDEWSEDYENELRLIKYGLRPRSIRERRPGQ